MRLWAKRHGWSLTDLALMPPGSDLGHPLDQVSGHARSGGARRGGRHGGVHEGGSLVVRCEADAFAALGLEYRRPEDRDV